MNAEQARTLDMAVQTTVRPRGVFKFERSYLWAGEHEKRVRSWTCIHPVTKLELTRGLAEGL